MDPNAVATNTEMPRDQFPGEKVNVQQETGIPVFASNLPGRHDVMLTNLHLGDINPIICGEQHCEPGHSYGYKIRSYYVLHYIVSGCGVFIANNQTYHISQGQIFIIRPSESTFYKADSISPWHYRWVGFTTSLKISEILPEDVVSVPECEYIFRSLMDSDKIEKGREYFVCAKIFEFLSLAVQRPKSNGYRTKDYMLKAKNFIEANYCNSDISVHYIAQLLHLDRSYFSATFRKYLGMSPHQYIVDCRLRKAAELISRFSYSPCDAALACGYTNVFNFSKMFKKMFGICPSQYKNIINRP